MTGPTTRRRPTTRRAGRSGAGRRIDALDTFRGLAVVAVLAGLAVGDPGSLPDPLDPAPWHGLRPADLVAPFLLVSSGAALACTRSRHRHGRAAAGRLARRVVVLLGVAAALALLAGGAPTDIDATGALPRLALAWLAVWAVAALPRWAQGVVAGGVLLAHSVALEQVDPGVMATFGALPTVVVSVLAGFWLGDWLRSRPDGPATAVAAALTGVYIGAAGIVAAQVLPLNRTLWTATFVLVSTGAALLAFAAVYTLVTVLPLGRPLARVTRLGQHAFVAYVAVAGATAWLGAGAPATPWSRLLRGAGGAFGAELGALLVAAGVVALAMVLVGVVQRRGWYLRA